MTPRQLLQRVLERRLAPSALQWSRSAESELALGAAPERFSALLSLASRHARRMALELDERELAEAGRALEGWNPERWTLLEALRVALVLARTDLADDAGVLALTEAFRYADEGELCALYRSLALLPGAERFAWRAGEGCRSNMRTVFEAAALDTPYPALHFDDVAWRQAVIKCLFVGAPLWRLWRLDARLSPELARMALDLADERRSAGRPVPHELLLCLGAHGGARGLDCIERELAGAEPLARAAAVVALARAGETARLAALGREALGHDNDPLVRAALERARTGNTGSATFRSLTAATP